MIKSGSRGAGTPAVSFFQQCNIASASCCSDRRVDTGKTTAQDEYIALLFSQNPASLGYGHCVSVMTFFPSLGTTKEALFLIPEI